MTLSAAQALFYNQSALILSGLPQHYPVCDIPPHAQGRRGQPGESQTLALMLSILHLLCFCAGNIPWGLHCAVHAMFAHQARQD